MQWNSENLRVLEENKDPVKHKKSHKSNAYER